MYQLELGVVLCLHSQDEQRPEQELELRVVGLKLNRSISDRGWLQLKYPHMINVVESGVTRVLNEA